MDVDQFKSRMHSLAFGNAMMHAAEDYKREVKEKEWAAAAAKQYGPVDMEAMADDPELQKLYEDRIEQLKEQAEKRTIMQRRGHGKYEEVDEKDFLEVVTRTELAVCHFFHREFERCRIMDKHLGLLSQKYFETRFFKISAPDSPFFTEKLKVKVLPCVIMFVNGVATDRVVGFDEFGKKDDFTTGDLEDRFLAAGVVKPKIEAIDGVDEDGNPLDDRRRAITKGLYQKTESDEDSDFD